jgi:hypothetical protein
MQPHLQPSLPLQLLEHNPLLQVELLLLLLVVMMQVVGYRAYLFLQHAHFVLLPVLLLLLLQQQQHGQH